MTVESAKILVIRHELCSSLGMLRSALSGSSAEAKYLDAAQGDRLTTSVEEYSNLVILGGPISAYEDDQYPYLRYEFQLIEQAISLKIPTLGICLGSQILARVLGANVYRGAQGREAGWCEIQLLNEAKTDPLLSEFPSQFRVFESHQDTFDIPAGCIRLAKSNQYPNQAFRYDDFVWAIQFHLEIDENVLGDCSAIIEQELIDSKLHDTSVEQLIAEAKRHSPSVAPLAKLFMQKLLQQQPNATALNNFVGLRGKG